MCNDRGVLHLLYKYYRFFICLLVVTLVFSVTHPTVVTAAQLQSTTIRLQSISPNQTSSPIYVQTTIPGGTAATEDQVRVTVPNAWSVSGGAGVSVSSLPAGVTAWPGISYSSTNGQTLTFSSSDLAPGGTYGFYITSGVGSNPSSVEESQWLLETYAGGSQVDTATVAISILPNSGTVTVNGEVQAAAAAFSLDLDRTAPISSSITAGDTVSYEITYNHSLQYSSSMTFVASWSSDTPVLEYVIGSATTAYGGTAPVIDTVNNTITWTTTSMPPGTADQTVAFSLQAGTVVSEATLPITIQAQITAPTTGTATSEQLSYQYEPPATPIPTPTPDATPDPDVTPTIIPSPSPTVLTGQVLDVQVVALQSTTAQIHVQLDSVMEIRLLYQSDSGEIKSISGVGDQNYLFELEDLLPNMTYYFWIVDTQTGDRLTTEMFSFTTTYLETSVTELVTSGIIAYQGVWLQEWQPLQSQVLVSQVGFDVNFTLAPTLPVLSSAWLEMSTADGNVLRFPLSHAALERLQTKLLFNQSYEFVRASVHAQTVDGLLLIQQLGTVNVVPPLRVVSSVTGAPLPHALMEVAVRNPQSNTFQILSLSELVRTSTNDGIFPLLLSPGSYEISISSSGFTSKEVELLWPSPDSHSISLEPLHGGFFGWVYQLPVVGEKTREVLAEQVVPLLQNESIVQAAELGAGVTAASVATILIAIYGSIPLHILPSFIWQAIKSGTLFGKGGILSQQVIFRDVRTGQLLAGVGATVWNKERDKKNQLRSSRYGRVVLSGNGVNEVLVQKEGYKDATALVVQNGAQTEILLTPEDDTWHAGLHVAKKLARVFLGYGIELLLAIIVLFELGLVIAVGWKAVPFFLISLAASVIWFYYHIVVHHHIEIE